MGRYIGKEENELHSQEKKKSIETNPEMAQILHSAKILKQFVYVQRAEGKYGLNKQTDWKTQQRFGNYK